MLDHAAIYVLIAGTYTPFTLGILRGAWGWTLFGLVWTLAGLGIVFKTLLGFRYPRASALLYVVMGWLAVIAIQPMTARVPAAGLVWLVGGGLLDTGAIAFFAWERRPAICTGLSARGETRPMSAIAAINVVENAFRGGTPA